MAKAKAKRRSGGGGKKRKSGRNGRVLSLTALLWITWMLNRMGIFSKAMFDKLLASGSATSIGDAVGIIESEMKANFVGSGMGTTLASGFSLAIVTLAIRWAAKGSVPISGKVSALRA